MDAVRDVRRGCQPTYYIQYGRTGRTTVEEKRKGVSSQPVLCVVPRAAAQLLSLAWVGGWVGGT